MSRVLEHLPWLSGASMAWRRSMLSGFAPLTMASAPTSHDRIMAVRAALGGEVVAIDALLLSYRRHRGNASKRLGDERTRESVDFGHALTRSLLIDVLEEDLAEVRSWPSCGIGQAGLVVLDRWLSAQREQSARQLRASYGELLRSGRALLWVDEDELALANERALGDRLRRRAAVAVSVRTAVERARRTVGRLRRLALGRPG